MNYFITLLLLLPTSVVLNESTDPIEDSYHLMLVDEFGLSFDGLVHKEALNIQFKNYFSDKFDLVSNVSRYHGVSSDGSSLYVFKIDGTKSSSKVTAAIKVSYQSYCDLSFESSAVDCQCGYCLSNQIDSCGNAIIGILCGCKQCVATYICNEW